MYKAIREFFEKAMKWIVACWDRHDELLAEIVTFVIPMVIEVALRPDLTGEQKRKAIVDAIVDNAEAEAEEISTSMLNEAVEIAANKYNIHLGILTTDKMEAAAAAAQKAARDYANRKLRLTGTEAEDAGVTLSNEDLE